MTANRSLRLTVLSAAALLLLAPSLAQAQIEREIVESTSPKGQISISPPRIEADVDRGERTTKKILVYNNSDAAQDVTVIPSDYGAASNPRSIGQVVQDSEFGAGDWITPEIVNFRLKPFEQIQFDVVIEVPADAPTGTNMAAIAVRGGPAQGAVGAMDVTTSGGSAVSAEGLVQTFLTVEGEVRHELEITKFVTRDTFIFGSSRIVVWDVGFRNDGTVTEHVEGNVDIRSIFGTRADRIKIQPTIVLRGTERNVRVIWRDVPWVGAFTPKLNLRGDDAKEISRTGSRTVLLPWWVIPVIVLAILIPALWIWIRRRREWAAYLEDEGDADDEDWHDPTHG